MNRAVFLDRDGTLNQDHPEYVKNIREFRLFYYSKKAVRLLKQLSFKVVVVTNQSAIGRGLCSYSQLERIHRFLGKELQVDRIYFCPHVPVDQCSCRKPGRDLVDQAKQDFDLDLSQCYFVGDKEEDIHLGGSVGCQTFLVQSGLRSYTAADYRDWAYQPNYVVANVYQAAIFIQQLEKGTGL
jgi:histidinol-phosphate phosphatase family protein